MIYFSEKKFYFRKNSIGMDMDSMMEDYGSYMKTVRKFNIPCYMWIKTESFNVNLRYHDLVNTIV